MPASPRPHARRPWRSIALVAAPSTTAARQEPPARPTARLEYTAEAEACPNAAAFRREVATRLGYDPFVAEASVVVRATVARGAAGLVGRVATFDGEGRALGGRELGAPGLRCVDLVEAMAVTTALRRLEATLADEAADDRGTGIALGIAGGTLGAVLVGLGTYALVSDGDRDAAGYSLLVAGGGLAAGVVLANVSTGGSAAELLGSAQVCPRRRTSAGGVHRAGHGSAWSGSPRATTGGHPRCRASLSLSGSRRDTSLGRAGTQAFSWWARSAGGAPAPRSRSPRRRGCSR